MSPIKIAIVGVGKIARDQHIPVIAASPDFTLVCAASRNATVDGVQNFTNIDDMLTAFPDIQAVALCTPPQDRHLYARSALTQGKHVLLEKPPGATLSEIEEIAALAERHRRTLFATWHSRFAPAVEPARAWLSTRTIKSVSVAWKEDVRHWHPGQEWIWQPGGLGVFDPGINALSIMTRILPHPFFLKSGTLSFPENRYTPIAADLSFTDSRGIDIRAEFDWRQTGPQTWDIDVSTDDGTLSLQKGGSVLSINGVAHPCPPEAEYRGVYDRFAQLIAAEKSDIDIAPLRHVADAFLLGRHERVASFV